MVGTSLPMDHRHNNLNLVNSDPGQHKSPATANSGAVGTTLEELIHRAKAQSRELSQMIQRLEQLRRDIDRHLPARSPSLR